MARVKKAGGKKTPTLDVERRKPVWIALSDLWLDTELQAHDLRHIAGVLRASGYTVDELRGIYLYEVAPVVYRNLFSVAGAWAGFDPTWLCNEAEKRARQRCFLTERRFNLMRRWMTYATEQHWESLVALLDAEAGGERGEG